MQQGLSASAGPEIPALLAEDYWFEESDLQIRETDGERVVSHVSLVWKQSEKSFESSGYALNIFYVQANGVIKKRRITGYPLFDHNPFYGITDSTYRFTYGSGGSSIRVTHTKECKIGWFTDRELQVISASEDRIVLETSIRDFTRREPVLPEDFAGIRTVWIRITDPTNVGKWGRRPDKRHSQLGLGLGFGAETGALTNLFTPKTSPGFHRAGRWSGCGASRAFRPFDPSRPGGSFSFSSDSPAIRSTPGI